VARRFAKEPVKRKPTKKAATKGNRRRLGTDDFSETVRTQSFMTVDGFERRTSVNMQQALVDLGPAIRNMALDDSMTELLVAWGRCAEKRIGMALYIEDVIRSMTPADCKVWRMNIYKAALGEWADKGEL
jgi:hypothetical protein